MKRLSFSKIIAVTGLLALAGLMATQHLNAEDGMISSVDAARAGLRVEWFTQLDVDAAGGHIVDIALNVNENDSTTFFAIMYGNQREMISEKDISPFGTPFGANPDLDSLDRSLYNAIQRAIRDMKSDEDIVKDLGTDEPTVAMVRKQMIDRVAEAEEAAKTRQERLRALFASQRRQVDVKIEKFTLPKSTLYAVTSSGVVQAIDADTGQTHWTSEIGNRRHPTIGVGASNEYVAALNGSTVYCMEVNTGKVLWSQRCRAAIGASPAVGDHFVFVPLMNGRLEAFSLDAKGIGSESFVSVGRAMSRPLLTDNSVSWATDRGLYTVAPNDEVRSPFFRLTSQSEIMASGAAKGGQLFVASSDGFAYGIDEARGTEDWAFSTGQRITQSPVAVGDYVYLVTDEDQMYKLVAATGRLAPKWQEPIGGVRRFVSASKDKIYVQNAVGNILAINQESGAQVNVIRTAGTNLILAHTQSDRMYVGNRNGLIQCLREITSDIPFFHGDEPITKADADRSDPFAGVEEDEPKAKDKTDPFGGAADDKNDPFGGGVDKKKDPPGGAADDKKDPFGGGSKGKKDPNDPFGGG